MSYYAALIIIKIIYIEHVKSYIENVYIVMLFDTVSYLNTRLYFITFRGKTIILLDDLLSLILTVLIQ